MKRLVVLVCLIVFLLPYTNSVEAGAISSSYPLTLLQDVKSAIRQADARYESGNVSGAADLARKILAKYPGNVDAQTILDKCIAKEKSEFESAITSLNVDTLSAFQKKYPSSTYNEEITRYIADVPLWKRAKDTNSIDSYNEYLSESSQLLFKQEATDAIQDITVNQAFNKALTNNTIKAYEEFRADYPNSKHDDDACNKIARLLADNFNSRSSYADKSKALDYAKNEKTRDYVRNKFDRATASHNSSYSTTYSASSSSGNSGSRSTSSSYGINATRPNSSVKSIRFGLNILADLGYYSNMSGDLWYDGQPYSLGIGGLVRFGDQRKPVNFITGVKLLYSNISTKYTYWDSYDYSNQKDNTSNASIAVPLELNWNFLSSEYFGMYLGLGYQGGVRLSSSDTQILKALKIAFGLSWTHGEWNFYYLKYFSGPFNDTGDFSPYIGTSYTYYF